MPSRLLPCCYRKDRLVNERDATSDATLLARPSAKSTNCSQYSSRVAGGKWPEKAERKAVSSWRSAAYKLRRPVKVRAVTSRLKYTRLPGLGMIRPMNYLWRALL